MIFSSNNSLVPAAPLKECVSDKEGSGFLPLPKRLKEIEKYNGESLFEHGNTKEKKIQNTMANHFVLKQYREFEVLSVKGRS